MSVDYSSYGYAVDKRLALLLWISGQVRVQVVSKNQEGSGFTAQLQEGIFQSCWGELGVCKAFRSLPACCAQKNAPK